MFTLQRSRTTSTARVVVQYLTVRNTLPEFQTPGNSRSGVGVSNLKQWKTEEGAQRWMQENASWLEGMRQTGSIGIVKV